MQPGPQARMLERGGLVGFGEHPSLIVWKSKVRKSSEKTFSGVIWREVRRQQHAKSRRRNAQDSSTKSHGNVAWWLRESLLLLHSCSRVLSRLASSANWNGELAMFHARCKQMRKGFRFLNCSKLNFLFLLWSPDKFVLPFNGFYYNRFFFLSVYPLQGANGYQ